MSWQQFGWVLIYLSACGVAIIAIIGKPPRRP